MGVHRQPIAQKIAKGTYRPHIHGPLTGYEMEPLIEENDPRPPQSLSVWGREVWTDLFPKLTKAGILTGGERDIFMVYCDSVGMYNRACEQINRNGLIKDRKDTKRAKRNSVLKQTDEKEEGLTTEERLQIWYKIRRDAMSDIARFATLLGLTVPERGKVLTAKKKGADSPKSVPITRPKTALDRLATENP